MSLLDRGPDVVLVYPEVLSDDGYGTPVRAPSNVPVEVRGHVQPFNETSEGTVEGQTVGTSYRLIARDFPGGAWARVVWDGREWDVLGEPKRYRSTLRTTHVAVTLRARTAAPLDGDVAVLEPSAGYSAGY